MIKLVISGACGKMGSRILNLAQKDKDFKIIAGLEQKNHPQVGKIINNVLISSNQEDLKNADCFVDFTTPLGTLENLAVALKYKKPLVIGTTGFSPGQTKGIKKASKKIPIVFSPNMSIGVNLFFRLVRELTSKLSKDYKVNIIEAHHVHKKDAPSGTAKKIKQIIDEFGQQKVLGVQSIREGEIVGDHKVIFESDFDKIELFHSAKTRDIFAQGALVAAKWLVKNKKKNGLYDMGDILG
ncbi:MAG: 4-hydroxy-tetrahydrodipicolinate reductase [Candidatus Omnitrophota bacterium]